MSVDQEKKSNSLLLDANVDIVVKNLSLFSSIGDTCRQQLLDEAEQKTFPAQSLIIQEGELGAEMYIILDGWVDVFATSDDGYETNLSVLAKGDYFGEQALLPSSNGYRTASVRARTDVLALVIDKHSFNALLEEDHNLAHSLEVIGEKYFNQRLLQESALFRAIPVDSDIREHIQKKTYLPGEEVIREGEVADNIYVILEGEVEVYQTVAGKQVKRHSLGPGRYFGELAFINNEPRNATVVAKTSLRVLALDGKQFSEIFRQTPELNARFSDLNGFYKLPGEGYITLHSSKYLDMNAVTAIYHIHSKACMSITRVIGIPVDRPICSITLAHDNRSYKNKQTIKYQQPGGIYRELVFGDGYVRSGVFYGIWDDLPFLLEALLKGKKLHPWQRYLFEKEGRINLERDRLLLDDSAVVCQCTGVTLGVLKQAMQEGCVTAEQLADATGASRVCGGCAPLLKEVAGLSHMDIIGNVQVIPRTKTIKSIRLTPKLVNVQPYQAGQHIRVEGLVNGQWIQRPYTLTSSTVNRQYYEITVKNIPDGVFSSWLHDELNKKSILRISKPEGGFDLAVDQVSCPYICLVAGIGITPALSLMRSDKIFEKHRVYIDISARKRDDIPCLDEILQMAQEHEQLTVNIRLSKENQRIGQPDINQLSKNYPNAVFIVCGPSRYQDDVIGYLELAGINVDRIHTESFSASANISSVNTSIKTDRLSFWLSITVLLLISGFLAVPQLPYVNSIQELPIKEWLYQDIHRQISGYAAISFVAIGLIISMRKRFQFFKWGDYAKWRLFHIIMGSLALVMLATHTALSMGNNLSFAMFTIFMSVLITGVFTMLTKMAAITHPNSAAARFEKQVTLTHIWVSLAMPAVLVSHILASYYY